MASAFKAQSAAARQQVSLQASNLFPSAAENLSRFQYVEGLNPCGLRVLKQAKVATLSTMMKLTPTQVVRKIKEGELRVAVVGCDVKGLSTAYLFAEAGAMVVGVDQSLEVVRAVRLGRSMPPEPQLGELLIKHVKSGRFTPTTEALEAVRESDVVNITVPTSVDENMRPNYSSLFKAAENIGKGLRTGSLVVVSSTVGPGMTEEVVRKTVENYSGLKAGPDFGLAYTPIRASAGTVIDDMRTRPRVVGGLDERSLEVAAAVLGAILKPEVRVMKVRDIKTAEVVELFENTYRLVSVTLSNELATLCEKIGVDYYAARDAAVTDEHCHLLLPGAGVGGQIPENLLLLTSVAEDYGVNLGLTRSASKVNDEMVGHGVKLVMDAVRACGRTLRRSTVAFLGVSFKPNVKEARGSRSLEVLKALMRKGAKVNAYDPYFTPEELQALGIPGVSGIQKALDGANCVVLAVGHTEFSKISLGKIRSQTRKPIALIDFNNFIDPVEAERSGFIYRGVGRGVWTR